MVEHGATTALSHRNACGFTPLMYAAHNDRTALLDYFVGVDSIPRTEKIHGLELLGAKQLLYAYGHLDSFSHIYSDYSWYIPGFNLLHQAMDLRYENQNELCLKELAPQNKLYNNYAETRTMDELMNIEGNGRALRAEAYLILQRLVPKEIMQVQSRHISHEYDYSSFKVAEALGNSGAPGSWEEGVEILNFLISLLVESSSQNKWLVSNKMLSGIKSYLKGVLGQRNPGRFYRLVAFKDIHHLLQLVIDTVVIQYRELSNSPVGQCQRYQEVLDDAAWIVYALTCLYPEDEVLVPLIQVLEKLASWSIRWSAQWENFNHTKVLGESGEGVKNGSPDTCRKDTNDDYISVTHALITSAAQHPGWDLFPKKVHVVQKVFCRVIVLDHVNAVNFMLTDKRLLHKAIDSWHSHLCWHPRRVHKAKTIHTIITLLIRYGFTWSQKDKDRPKGRTITEMLQPPMYCSQTMHSAYSEALELLESLKRCNLQELAARVIRNYHIPYRGVIPKLLHDLIEME